MLNRDGRNGRDEEQERWVIEPDPGDAASTHDLLARSSTKP